MLDFSMRGGVPVFSLADLSPIEWRLSVRPSALSSPIRPALIFLSPMCMTPERNVPDVIIADTVFISSPDLNRTDLTLPETSLTETTSPTRISTSLFLTAPLTSFSYCLLSICARGDHTARPFFLFSTLN